MNLENQLLFFLSALGVFNGFLVSIYFLFFTSQKRLSNYFLGFLLLMLGIRIGKSVLIIFVPDIPKIYLQIGLSSCFLIGPALYFYLKSSLNNVKKLERGWKIHLSVTLFIILSAGILFPYKNSPDFWNTYFVKIIYVQWILYMLASGFVLKDIFKKLFIIKEQPLTIEIWLLCLYIGCVLICASYMYGYFRYYIAGPISFSFVFYALAFFLLFKKNRSVIFSEPPPKYTANKIDAAEARSLLEKLDKLMIEKELYKNPDIKLNEIAKEINLSGHRLSQLLNDNSKKSFALYVNEFRVAEAKKLLGTNDQFTLEAIGFDAGFSSKSTFYAIFKKLTGLTPAQYKKQLE